MYFSIYFYELAIYFIYIYIILNKIYQKDIHNFYLLATGSLYGLILEYIVVNFSDDYSYNYNFIIQLGSYPNNIPLCVGLCWGMIAYSCMKFSDMTGFKPWTRPFFDGFIALTFDLSMDTIAIRLADGFWKWNNIILEDKISFNSFFGVPYGNFLGWFLIIFIFSFINRLLFFFINIKHIKIIYYITFFITIPFICTFFFYYGFNLLCAALSIVNQFFNFQLINTKQGIRLTLILLFLIISAFIHFFSWLKNGRNKNQKYHIFPVIFFSFMHISFIIFCIYERIYDNSPSIILISVINVFFLYIHNFILLSTSFNKMQNNEDRETDPR